MSQEYRAQLERGIAQLELALNDEQIERLLAYHAMLVKWNKAYNLTSVRDPAQMIARHLIDSLSIVPFIKSTNLLDVGTGPGLPGMIIALINPALPVYMLDSNGKKTRFLNQVKMELKVDNAEVIHHRLESWQPGQDFNQITSRAFATLSDMVGFSRHLLSSDGRFIAMKGQYPEDEIAQLPEDIDVLAVSPIKVPGNEGERHMVELGIR
ncbi:16S rRNA (guanine(527)-N(7))-methyltransferase RsmG [Reinekea marina]|uniref:Ribosomal RNA small subunit methyltransferase G n=1 Tax=Reinekea marina TaxID=1310421 RepID=A0ABV7WSE0_9GAMM|nr:16S rRNA (guanine(527)-N(7))-methyltransferase RsmG [Reinekea marina]MDN3647343.1 16S rRNA (guanine(527)-N(7))-methyltransferase RsmG [Reinekea marina]